jgi:hypothetical protein
MALFEPAQTIRWKTAKNFLSQGITKLRPVETRRCPRCRRDKPLADFGWRDQAHTKRQSYCRDCNKETWRDWYREERNHEHHLQLVAARRKRRIARHRELVLALKSVPCADCGASFPPYVMDFDHLSQKQGEISSSHVHIRHRRVAQGADEMRGRLRQLSSDPYGPPSKDQPEQLEAIRRLREVSCTTPGA